MTNPKIISISVLDQEGIANTWGFQKTWAEMNCEAPGTSRALRQLTHNKDQTFRRLDRPTRALVLAAEACGVSNLLTPEQRNDTALFIETARGCIEADLRYARLLRTGVVHAAIFPYTLQSTCLGDVTLRHGLRGQTLSLSVEPGDEGEALREAKRVLRPGGPQFVLAGVVDALDEPQPGAAPILRAVVCLLAAPEVESREMAPWPASHGDPFVELAAACRAAAIR
jgi:hypothetical protein